MTSREARRSIREDVHKYYAQKAAREHESQRSAQARLIGFLIDAGGGHKLTLQLHVDSCGSFLIVFVSSRLPCSAVGPRSQSRKSCK